MTTTDPQQLGAINNFVRMAHESEVAFGSYHDKDRYSVGTKMGRLIAIGDALITAKKVLTDPEDDDTTDNYERALANVVRLVFDIAGAHDFDFHTAIESAIRASYRREPLFDDMTPSPLSCDCYAGCWAIHSQGWPEIPKRFRVFCVEHFEPGTFVVMKESIRVISQDLVDRVTNLDVNYMKPEEETPEQRAARLGDLTNIVVTDSELEDQRNAALQEDADNGS